MTIEEQDTEKPVRILIVDKDTRFGNTVKKAYAALKEAEAAKPEDQRKKWPRPVTTDTVRESQSYLSNRDYEYAGVFINPSMGTPAWLALIRTSHQYRPNAPVFVVFDEKPKLAPKDAANLGVHGFVPKPVEYEKMLELIRGDQAEEASGSDEAGETPRGPAAPSAPASTKDEDYVDFKIEAIYGSLKSLFDLFVRLSPGKYIQVLKKGDVLSADRIDSYKKKGVTQLFVPKAQQEAYLSFCDEMTAQIMKDTSVSVEVKSQQVVAQGQAVMSFLGQSQFSEKSLASAQQYVANTTEIVKQLSANSDLVKKIMADVALMEHGVACSTMAALFIKHLGGANQIINAVGLACFLHDAALAGQNSVLTDERVEKMDDAQKAIFFSHPIEGAKVVKRIKGIPPALEAAVLEHHLRIGKKGFPENKLTSLPNRIAELIGLCEEFVWLTKAAMEAPEGTGINPWQIMESRITQEFSEPLVQAFKRAMVEK